MVGILDGKQVYGSAEIRRLCAADDPTAVRYLQKPAAATAVLPVSARWSELLPDNTHMMPDIHPQLHFAKRESAMMKLLGDSVTQRRRRRGCCSPAGQLFRSR
jgi:hypothetical protein